MKQIRVSLSDEEYSKILKIKGPQTHRELFLKSLGLEAPPKKLGRPTLDEINKRLKSMREELRENEWLDRRDKMRADAENCTAQEELDSMFDKAQKKRRGG